MAGTIQGSKRHGQPAPVINGCGRPFTTSKVLQTVGREKAVVGPKHGCKKHGQPAPVMQWLWPAILCWTLQSGRPFTIWKGLCRKVNWRWPDPDCWQRKGSGRPYTMELKAWPAPSPVINDINGCGRPLYAGICKVAGHLL